MGLYLYCFVPSGHGPGAELAGVAGEPVRALDLPETTLWVGEQDSAPEATLEGVRAHHGVVKAAWASAPACLPVRFGQWSPSLQELVDDLSDDTGRLLRALERVRGAGEHGVRILAPPADDAGDAPGTGPEPEPETASARATAGAGSGARYLEAVRTRLRRGELAERRAAALAAELEAALGPTLRDQRVEPPSPSGGLLGVTHLVPRASEEEYRRRLEAFRKSRPELRFMLSGPWPPYSFAP